MATRTTQRTRTQFSIYGLMVLTTCIGFIFCGIVSFNIWLDDIPAVLNQLFAPGQVNHWTGVYVETTGRAVLLGVMVGTAIITVLSYKVVRWR